MAGLLISLTAGPGSPLFPLFTFILASAAFRDGAPAVRRAAAILAPLLLAGWISTWFLTGEWLASINFFVVRAIYILVMAFLLGYLADQERRLRQETSVIARTLARIRDARTHKAALGAAADEVGRTFGASSAVILSEADDGLRHSWHVPLEPEMSGPFRHVGLPAPLRDAYWFPLPPNVRAWHSKAVPGGSIHVYPPIREGPHEPRHDGTWTGPPASFWEQSGCHTMLGITMTVGQRWQARAYLLDPAMPVAPRSALELFHAVALQVAPALLNTYLISRVRAEVAVAERERLSRELHDRVVQSLIGIEMQLAVLGTAAQTREALVDGVKDVRQSLREEIATLRDLMHELRPLELSSTSLLPFLADLVTRFKRETGIRASFAADVAHVTLSPRTCGELARIVQEALVNVRRHSQATAVHVRVAAADSTLTLIIEDNGRGFAFDGRLEDDELWRERRGPAVIHERARSIGAFLTVNSTPGRGARLDVQLPYAC